MIGRETAVPGRMPILRGHDQVEHCLRLQLVDKRNYLIAFRIANAPPGQKSF